MKNFIDSFFDTNKDKERDQNRLFLSKTGSSKYKTGSGIGNESIDRRGDWIHAHRIKWEGDTEKNRDWQTTGQNRKWSNVHIMTGSRNRKSKLFYEVLDILEQSQSLNFQTDPLTQELAHDDVISGSMSHDDVINYSFTIGMSHKHEDMELQKKKHYSAWHDVINYHRDDVIAGPGYLEYSWIMQKKRIGIKLWKSTEWLQEKRAGDVIYDWPIRDQHFFRIWICVGVILSLRTNQWWPCKTHATHNTQKEPKVTWVPSRVEFWRHRWVYYIKYILESISNSWRHHTG